MFQTILPDEIATRRAAGEKLVIIDVREQEEWDAGHIPGTKHIPLAELPVRKAEIDPQVQTIIMCHAGGRSAKACEYLAMQGYDVVNMLGGISAWRGEVE